MQITTIGLDIAKNVFQVHGINASEKVVVRKQVRRSQVLGFFKALPPCLVGMEACATAHYWARELTKLGHQVRLMPARDVAPERSADKSDSSCTAGTVHTWPRLCENSKIEFACRNFVSISSVCKPTALATAVGRRQ